MSVKENTKYKKILKGNIQAIPDEREREKIPNVKAQETSSIES